MANISKFRNFHGITFNKDVSDSFAHLVLWQRHKEEPFCHANFISGSPHEHFLAAVRSLFTRSQVGIHPWFERMAVAYTNEPVVIMMGAASSSKSFFAGVAVLLDYIASFAATEMPDGTSSEPGSLYANMVSTTKETLLKRSLASSIECLGYLRSHPDFFVPFRFISQKCAIVPDTGSGDIDVASVKSRIDGIAISEGSAIDAKGAVIGVHLPRVRSVADELENMGTKAQVFLDAQDNLMAGTQDYKRLILFNPQAEGAPGSKLAEPPGGYRSITLDTDEWRNKAGELVLRFDGHKSPGRKHPTVYPYLPNDAFFKKVLARNGGNADSPGYMSFVRAFPPPSDGHDTVLTREMIGQWGMDRLVQWESRATAFAALDPAFTSGGNDCKMVRGYVGRELNSHRVVIAFDPETYTVPIYASSPIPVLQQIGEGVKKKLHEWDIPITHFACDDSGTQNVADHLEILLGRGLYRCNYSARPPKVQIGTAPEATADKKYRNTVTFLYYSVNEFGQFGQIRGLPAQAVEEFCGRRLDERLKGTLTVETKTQYKARMKDGESPDTADCCAMLVGMVRDRFGFQPGSDHWGMEFFGDDYPGAFNPPDMRAINNLECLDGRYC